MSDRDYDPHAPPTWRHRLNAAGVLLIDLVLAITNRVAAAWRRVEAGRVYAANRLACCAACHERFEGVLRHPLTAVVVLLIGLSINTGISVHYAKKGAQQATEIDAAAVARARKLYRLRKYTDDGIHDLDEIVRSYSPEHPGVVLPPPLPPEPDYDVDNIGPATTQPASKPANLPG